MSSEWQRYRQQREAEERAEQQEAQLREQRRIARERAEQQRFEEIQRREHEEGLRSCQRLEQELRSTDLPQIAEEIHNEWARNNYGVGISFTLKREPRVRLNGDGSISGDISSVGYMLSYSYEDIGEKWSDDVGVEGSRSSHDVKTKGGVTLNFGLQYADVDRLQGAKSYFVNCYGRPGGGYFPYTVPSAKIKFFESLYNAEMELAPTRIVREAQARVREHKEKHRRRWW